MGEDRHALQIWWIGSSQHIPACR